VGASLERRRHFDLTLESVRVVRSFVRNLASGAGADPDVAALLASELAANAVFYAKTMFEVRVIEDTDILRVEVVDDAPERVAALREPTDESGRGLHIVEALARRWGVDVVGDEKVIWFELATVCPGGAPRS
jgi:anti-sigma regulatory factor (Ser/Thr protein kinase)